MAAEEQKREGVVAPRWRSPSHLERRIGSLSPSAGALAAPLVDQPPVGDRDQPRAGIVGNTVLRPTHGRREQRLLHGVLAGVEPTMPTDQRAEDLRRELAQQVLDTGGGGLRRRSLLGCVGGAL